MKIKLLAVGKIKEFFFKEACAEYHKRLQKYCSFEIIEIKDEGKEKEAEKIMEKIKDSFVVVLADEGKECTSLQFADFIKKTDKDITFILGGAYGVDQTVKQRANLMLSLSKMTFPHELCRVIFLEQLYRAHTILRNEKYHHE
jgi:23S rRNA (pseudouridine1915-N3)-methyltransferase